MVGIENSSKKKILEYLLVARTRENDFHGKNVKDIAAVVDISTNAVRNYLSELEKDEFVVKHTQKSGKGRPAVFYSIHNNALSLFPKVYAEFSVSLIHELIKQLGRSKTEKILSDVGKTLGKEILINNYDGADHASIEQRIITLVKIFEDYGKYPTVLEDEEFYYVRNSNCLLFSIVKEHSIICEVDHSIVKTVLNITPEKQQCLKSGDPFCQYRIMKT
ncbi:MAG: helix-turn-helix transcriptional regulator [Candidatus Hodarchaeales archaeon]